MNRACSFAALALALASCHLAEQRENPALGVKNVCSSSAECGLDGSCDRGRGRCVSTKYYSPDELVFEVTPSAVAGSAAGFAPGVPYYVRSVGVACSAGQSCLPSILHDGPALNPVAFGTLKVPPLTQVAVKVKIAHDVVMAVYPGCALPTIGDALRALVTLVPDDQARGLPVPTTLGSAPDGAGRIALAAQLDSYSLYVQLLAPPSATAAPCRVPPLLLRKYTSDPQTHDYPIDIPPPEHLQGTILGPPGVSFEGWSISIVDPATGLALSTEGVVGPPEGATSSFGGVDPISGGVSGRIDFHSPQDATTHEPGTYVLRLSPPAGASAPLPSFAWTSDVLAVGPEEQVTLNLSAYQPGAVTLASARMEDAATTEGVAGRVFIRSLPKGITGAPPGRPTGFATILDTDPSDVGRFDVALPPGLFEVVGVPSGMTRFGLERQHWQVGASPAVQGGRVLSVRPAPVLSASVTALGGTVAPNVGVDAFAAQGSAGAFDGVFALDAVLPRGGTGVTDASGAASLTTDAGVFDVVARFPQRSGFPWVIRRGAAVESDGTPLALSAGLPVVVSGRFAQPDQEQDVGVAGGTLRAFALLPPLGELPARYLQIAETSIDATGAYEILLPARVGP